MDDYCSAHKGESAETLLKEIGLQLNEQDKKVDEIKDSAIDSFTSKILNNH